MNHRLLWKLLLLVGLGSMLLFWLVTRLTWHAEEAMSFIAQSHQQTLRNYAAQAEALHQAGDDQALARWLQTLQQQENTWAAVVSAEVKALAGELSPRFVEHFGLGRDLSWKIHLYFSENPIMDIPFSDQQTHFLIQLPQRMRPGNYWFSSRMLLQLVLPLGLLSLLCYVLYQHLMQPVRRLEQATRQFSEGAYGVRVRNLLGSRNDELATLAETFDQMAERTGQLILTQRQRLSELSHELRTPLTRIDMAVSLAEQDPEDCQRLLERIRTDSQGMRRLVEDTLTLAWLENEAPDLRDELVDLTALLDSLVDDARFEFPQQQLLAELPAEAQLQASNHRALGQAVENVLRNALTHTPAGQQVALRLEEREQDYFLSISDSGSGVPEQWLESIFQPFFRVPGTDLSGLSGFGLGLALAHRQILAIGGTIQACNREGGGLQMLIQLPKGNKCKSDSTVTLHK